MKKYLIIIAGWHYSDSNCDFYEKIQKLSENFNNVDIFIASHRSLSNIDKKALKIIKKIKNCKIYAFQNIGYDWGAFSQAIDYIKKTELSYEYIFFMHDDIEIININFLDIFSQFIEKEKIVMAGNSENQILHSFQKTHPHIIEWAKQSEWGVKINSKRWSTIRGSFFATKKEVFDRIKKIPFKKGSDVRFGNWSLIIFCGLVSDIFGENSTKSISKTYLVSPYIVEYERGKKNTSDELTQSNEKMLTKKLYNKLLFVYRKLRGGYYRITRFSGPEDGLKIHVGCGNSYLQGYLNIDVLEQSAADVVCDAKTIDFKKNSVSEVLMYHFIEHIDKFEAEKMLEKIYGWLRPEGALIIECPDVVKVARLVIKNKRNIVELETGPHGFRGFYGEPVKNMTNWDYHKWGYSEFTLQTKLKKLNFSKVKVEKPVSHGRRSNRDLRIIAIK
ncbi:TPA: methyltransferase domain-containing protein [Candidatus Woesearchaeota archaeon]|nr:methyltransferase domain-containing protein [Candidatus Woesearchaeota archaeon]HIH31567.1 methyltransferase domain-containing protein [Candidatus Woesearchaeota archaeon]HIH54275.1 methyltransferase domain-containing protein [Candidatus Woesearchaeota archaeon]HIJ13419.1 methyltransferase domain-containing protein [Candidatus Woesearchaeota archaeon]